MGRGADPNKGEGEALRLAAFRGDMEICRLLFEHGADANLANSVRLAGVPWLKV